jgi:hypothetical protein
MSKIGFYISGSLMRAHDAAYVKGEDDLREAFVEQVVQSISTDVEVTVGEVKMHLAAWMDPDHWEDDWREAGVEDVDQLLLDELRID